MRLILILLTLSFVQIAFSQNESKYSFYGDVRLNVLDCDQTVRAIGPRKPHFYHFITSDTLGNILFYVATPPDNQEGLVLLDKDYNSLFILSPDLKYSIKGISIAPIPNDYNKYILFYVEVLEDENVERLISLDIVKNNGSWVTQNYKIIYEYKRNNPAYLPNKPTSTGTFGPAYRKEFLNLAYNVVFKTGTDCFWLLHDVDKEEFNSSTTIMAYKYSVSGISAPVSTTVSDMNDRLYNNLPLNSSPLSIDVGYDGESIALVYFDQVKTTLDDSLNHNEIQFWDFDYSTGKLENKRSITSKIYSIEGPYWYEDVRRPLQGSKGRFTTDSKYYYIYSTFHGHEDVNNGQPYELSSNLSIDRPYILLRYTLGLGSEKSIENSQTSIRSGFFADIVGHTPMGYIKLTSVHYIKNPNEEDTSKFLYYNMAQNTVAWNKSWVYLFRPVFNYCVRHDFMRGFVNKDSCWQGIYFEATYANDVTSFTYDFGDGTSFTTSNVSQSFKTFHIYNLPGKYLVKTTKIMKDGRTVKNLIGFA